MIYCSSMTHNQGYQMTDADIDGVLRYLQTNIDNNATREDAIGFLEAAQQDIHVVAHKLLQDVTDGKVSPEVIKEILKKNREAKSI